MSNMSNKTIVKNTIYLYLRMILIMGVNLFTSRIILQVLGVSDFGLYNAVGSIVVMFTFINGVLSSGTSRFITVELAKNNVCKLKETFSTTFYLHLIIAIIVLLFAETIGLWFLNNKMVINEDRLTAANWLYQFSVVSCMFSITQVPYNASIIAHEKMNIYAWVGVCEALWKLILILILLYFPCGDSLIIYGAIVMLWGSSLQVFYRFYCNKNFIETKLIKVKDKTIYKSILSFSIWDLIGSFCVSGNSQGLNILINLFFGVTVNAARAIAYQVEGVLQQFTNNFMTAVNPQITKRYSEGRIEDMFSLVFDASKYGFYLLFLVTLPVFIEAPTLLSLWLVDVPEYSVLFLRLLMVAMLIKAFSRPVVTAIHASGNIKWVNLVSGSFSILVQIPGTYLLYKMGCPAEAMFGVMMFVYLICNYLELYALYREVKFSILLYSVNVYVKSILLASIATLITYCISNQLLPSIWRVFITAISSTFSILLLVFYFGITSNTRDKIVLFIKKKVCK